MKRVRTWLPILALAATAVLAPVGAHAGPSSDSLLELAGKGGPSLGLGLGVTPLHWDLSAPAGGQGSAAPDGRVYTDPDAAGRAMSLDVTVKWPRSDLPIEPYLTLGPALIVDQPHEFSGLLGNVGDPVLHLGAKAGAGFNWRLTKDATLFGSYDVTTSAAERSPFGSKTAGAGGTAYDVLYGLRFRY
jgi:hypothetical protein